MKCMKNVFLRILIADDIFETRPIRARIFFLLRMSKLTWIKNRSDRRESRIIFLSFRKHRPRTIAFVQLMNHCYQCRILTDV